MAMVMIEKHGRTGGRKTTEQQRQEQQKAIVKRVSDAELELAKAKLKMEHTCGSSRPSVAAASHVSSCSADCEPKKIDVLEAGASVRLEPSDEPKKVDTSSADTNPYLVALQRMDREVDAFNTSVTEKPDPIGSETEVDSETEPLTEPGRPSDTFSMRPPLPYPIGYGEALPLQPPGSWWTCDFLEPVQYSNGEWNHALAQEWPAWHLW